MPALKRGRSWEGYVFNGPCEPLNPFVCFAEGDAGAGGDGGGAPAPKTFTQEEVSRIAAKEKSDGERAARAKVEQELTAKFTTEREELAKRIEELELAGKTAEQRAEHDRKVKAEADQKAREAREAAINKERDDARAEAAAIKSRWLNDKIDLQVSNALVASNALASASQQAARIFALDAKIDTNPEDGSITSIIYGGQSYTKPAEAAAAFLKANPHFAAAASPNGGSGARGGNGGNNTGKPLHELSSETLLQMHAEREAAAGKR